MTDKKTEPVDTIEDCKQSIRIWEDITNERRALLIEAEESLTRWREKLKDLQNQDKLFKE